ncbi:hypothetical protein M2128_002271 [Polynucleobacter sphagniphilus]|uniref:hypothetical protein n=1 Tax=Polynucleobacter sphagniphilus TaxID=1743169 RepID=UPI00247402BF|nr:hypothetical protein [Polynucleobacter sphagniphilus]MDH6303324.1 hypothetical protein [Polynucleobacter sphagniphilus]
MKKLLLLIAMTSALGLIACTSTRSVSESRPDPQFDYVMFLLDPANYTPAKNSKESTLRVGSYDGQWAGRLLSYPVQGSGRTMQLIMTPKAQDWVRDHFAKGSYASLNAIQKASIDKKIALSTQVLVCDSQNQEYIRKTFGERGVLRVVSYVGRQGKSMKDIVTGSDPSEYTKAVPLDAISLALAKAARNKQKVDSIETASTNLELWFCPTINSINPATEAGQKFRVIGNAADFKDRL